MTRLLEKLIVAAMAGEEADYSEAKAAFQDGKEEEPALLSKDLRRLFTGIKSPEDPAGFDAGLCYRWSIRGAVIKGCLDLRDARRPSDAPLATIEFYECTFEEGIWADGAHITRLHLSGCRIGARPEPHQGRAQISIKNLQIDNDVRFNDIRPIEQDGLLRVHATAVRIGTNFIVSRSLLRASDDPESADLLKVAYALDLRNARIGADLRISPDVDIRGGLSIQGSHIEGDVWVVGLQVHDGLTCRYRRARRAKKAPLRNAITLQNAHVEGTCRFWTRVKSRQFFVTGQVSMINLRVGADLSIVGLTIDADLDESASAPDYPVAISIRGAVVKGDLGWVAAESVEPDQCSSAPQGLETEIAHSDENAQEGTTFRTRSSEDVVKVEAAIKGTFELAGAEIGGSVWIQGTVSSISAPNISVGKDLTIESSSPVRQSLDKDEIMGEPVGSSAYGLIVLEGAHVNGRTQCTATYAYERWNLPPRIAEGRSENSPQWHNTGIRLNEATLRGLLWLKGTFEYIDGVNLKVEGDMFWNDTKVIYGVNLRKASLQGDCDLSGFRFFSRISWDGELNAPSLSMKDADIRRTLRLWGGRGTSETRVNNAHSGWLRRFRFSTLGENSSSTEFLQARIHAPVCYPDLQIVEVKAKRSVGRKTREEWVACTVEPTEPSRTLGQSTVFHRLNQKGYLRLQTDQHRLDYLRLFCAYVWAEFGPFVILEPSSDGRQPYAEETIQPVHGVLPQFEAAKVSNSGRSAEQDADITVHTRYAAYIFATTYRILRSGMVEMPKEVAACQLPEGYYPGYAYPYKYGPRSDISDYLPSEHEWQPLSQEELSSILPAWPVLFGARARVRTPSCYPELKILEIRTESPDDHNEMREEWIACIVGRSEPPQKMGQSAVLHRLNQKGYLRLQTDQQRLDYLRLFCAYVWGNAGAFAILEPGMDGKAPYTSQDIQPGQGELPTFSRIQMPASPSMDRVQALVRYSGSIFSATFELKPDGNISMADDKQLCKLRRESCPLYLPPYKYGRRARISDYRPEESDWRYLSTEELESTVPEWRALFERKVVYLENADVDLTDASCGTLEDDNGNAWGDGVRIRLENFSYAHTAENRNIKVPDFHWRATVALLRAFAGRLRQDRKSKSVVDAHLSSKRSGPNWLSNLSESGIPRTNVNQRLHWLEQRAYAFGKPESPEPFLPQPYTHLAKVLRDQGDEQAARMVEARRLTIESWRSYKQYPSAILSLPFWWWFRTFFNYGLSPLRAISTFLGCIAIGACGVHVANSTHLLVQKTTTSSGFVRAAPTGPEPAIPYVDGPAEAELSCAGSINEVWYAVDLFIPLLNLHQEERCDVRSESEHDRTPLAVFEGTPGKIRERLVGAGAALIRWPVAWQWAKASFAIVGRIVSSLMLLTVSGVLRKWESG